MICDNCKKERLITDFINNQKFCFRCEYQKKLEKTPKKQTAKRIFCRVCGKRVIHHEELKKRQRTVFCSLSCALSGHKTLASNHWTRQVRDNPLLDPPSSFGGYRNHGI